MANTFEAELSDAELEFLETFKRLIKKKVIRFQVDIEPHYAKGGSGQWNITSSYITINGEGIELDNGSVELIDPE
jgi:hypothetical protein